MEWFIAAVAVAALGVAAVAAAGGMGQMNDAVPDTYRAQLPDGLITAADLQQTRFGVVLRGYAMAQVDDLIDRLAREIAERDARIAELTGAAPAAEPEPGPWAEPVGETGEPAQRVQRVEQT